VRGTTTETSKIVAILAADVVGFSRMASADADRTLAVQHLALQGSRIAQNRPAEVKDYALRECS
jgi:class 3 adenylate cyclase